MTNADRNKWDRKYADKSAISIPEPDEWLLECVKELPPGRALDLACGLGQNALLLSEWGWDVDAVDISMTGLQIPIEVSESLVNWICADLDEWRPSTDYDLIVCFRFLDWVAIPEIVRGGLRPGGCFCYETFAASQMQRDDNHLKNEAFTVQDGDFQRFFDFLTPQSTETEKLSNRDVARFFGMRPQPRIRTYTNKSPSRR